MPSRLFERLSWVISVLKHCVCVCCMCMSKCVRELEIVMLVIKGAFGCGGRAHYSVFLSYTRPFFIFRKVTH